ncbi:glutamyl-Q tRNA(Asp) synthetase [Ectothiorhodosinus mongolicus]|uniref:Glutamyl-Q tRNA(Asp) synthetase n=1 Tax=Ectothiorhodosinus mongolicus TaxID=233100 RepID=A0A1R3VNA8_9GAMM|nr:tRNA glutamyl-Q(34) synthetase GluQRS [Ectothiorhodosinus mongolicus]ULX56480.1 tRNA glutamyl-Q(34) synthetase GluQRS [Ectothiorhodosinus mongolicus]SIT66070.1 glutamyl-Q tRNA(Asp) synthetase [Ectothiorhodosinus mongolicus]
MLKQGRYRGRFAPSPTGPLHLGSLISALASFLDARAHKGAWLVRIEDLDPPREQAGAVEAILDSLHAHGLQWDEGPLYQSSRQVAYQEALQQLKQQNTLFACGCSRADIASAASRHGPEGPIYPGTCRQGLNGDDGGRTLRLKVGDACISFIDRQQGLCQQSLADEVGDFVLRRADGLMAYQLAVVVDDAWQGITHVVRGHDLLLSTPRQIYLQQCLGLPTPHYLHHALIRGADGDKLSKQTGASALDNKQAMDNLRLAMAFLGLKESADGITPNLTQSLEWATDEWRRVTLQPC